MHELYNLKEMLVEELANYGKANDLSLSSLEVIDKLAHATKNIDKVIECYEEQSYSMDDSYMGGRSYRMSTRRGRAKNGRFVSRDGSDMARQLRDMANNAHDEQTRSEIERLASKIEQM